MYIQFLSGQMWDLIYVWVLGSEVNSLRFGISSDLLIV